MELIDVSDLIRRFSVEELNEAAEEYWRRMAGNSRLLAKPYNLGDADHILPQIGFLIQGLQLCWGMTVLDFGAGSCYASRILNQLGLRVISVDVSKSALEIGRALKQRWAPVGDVPEHLFSVFDGRRLDVPSNSVDRIFCLDAFHHVPNQDAILSEMGRVLKPGGIAGFSEPGPNHSRHPEAQAEMRTCKVIENDIVLTHIRESSQAYGFTDLKVSISTIHPQLVSLSEKDRYLSEPKAFLDLLADRVANYPIFFLYKGDPVLQDSRSASGGGLTCSIEPTRNHEFLQKGGQLRIKFDVKNTGSKTWLPSGPNPGSVNVGAMLQKRQTQLDLSPQKEYRSSLSHSEVTPGSVISGVELDLGDIDSGEYILEIDIVSEHVCWFRSNSVTIFITVE
jgi:SAM-dependent methyltransferase